jgi:hypothetical protein
MGSQRAAKSQENLQTHRNRHSIRLPAISAPNLTDHMTLTVLASVLEVHLLSGKEPRTTEADLPKVMRRTIARLARKKGTVKDVQGPA